MEHSKGTRFFEKLITLFFDLLTVNVGLVVTFWLRFQSNIFPSAYNPSLSLGEYSFPALILSICWITLFFFTGLYRDWYKESRFDEFVVVMRTVFSGIFILFILISADEIILFVKTGDRLSLLTTTQFATLTTYGICMLFFATINRFSLHSFLAWLFSKGIWMENMLVIGANDSGAQLVTDISKHSSLGYRIIGFVDESHERIDELCACLPILGTYAELPQIIRKFRINGIILSHIDASADDITQILNYCSDTNVTIYMAPSLLDVISGHFKTNQIFGVPLIVLLKNHMPSWQVQIKRLIDIVVSAAVLIIGAPIWLTLAAVIRIASPGPAVFRQERVGQNSKTFIMLKFRSMVNDAEKAGGPQWATKSDPRITPLGQFLRKTRLDEIPQFINVLKGEMSLVGPRPERAYFIEKLKKEIPWYLRRIKMKPGITGWAQVKHKYDETIEDVKTKVMYDLYYFENMSLALDLKIIFQTFTVMLFGKGAR
jgi:exopolysaccharide biosynthesis polyprenyl glycosylphosphotransferase